MRERCCVSLTLCVSLALLQQGGGFSPKRLRAMLLGVDKRRKGQQDGGADEEEDDGGGDYGVVPKDHARSDAGDGGCFCFVPPASPVLILSRPLLRLGLLWVPWMGCCIGIASWNWIGQIDSVDSANAGSSLGRHCSS